MNQTNYPLPATLNLEAHTPFGAIIIGDEILSGKRQDKHLSKLIELLGQRGLSLSHAHYVGDQPERITQVLKDAFAKPQVVFSFGGIGATPDDHTRQCAALALGEPLLLHPEAKRLITERMRQLASEKGEPFDADSAPHQQRLNMGTFPQTAQIIPNPYNNIPGFSCASLLGGVVHFVPGFPVMAWPMVEWVLDHYYPRWFQSNHWQERSVILPGAYEALLTPLMQSLESRFESIKIFSLPSVDDRQWGRHVELGVKGHPDLVGPAYEFMKAELLAMQLTIGAELVR